MNRTELIITTTIVLFIAFVLGWFASWLIHRLTRVTHADLGELDKMAQQLHDAEEARDAAILAQEAHESEMANKLTQTRAELRAAMEGLRTARNEAEDLRDRLAREGAS